jgi:hypothetical protein
MSITTQPPTTYITDDARNGLTVAAAGKTTRIALSELESPAVHHAVEALARDLNDVSGARVDIGPQSEAARIVVGTIGVSRVVDEAISAGVIDVSGLRDADGALRWEGFLIAATEDVLYLVGTDRRGTIYAIYDLAESMGVSPWRWWADVPTTVKDHVTVVAHTRIADWPAVRYRGIFINDEEELDAWSRLHTTDDTIGPETYGRIYELILRLKGNYLWPAMHVGAFNHDLENGRLAHDMGIVIGSTHCDMLLRSNEHEFPRWAAARAEPVEYDYSLTGPNREALADYWRESVEQNRDYEVSWTVGMRGIHDTGFRTAEIDNADLTEDEKVQARVRLLGQAISHQRDILADTLGAGAAEALQLFIPYKEALILYDAGLQVPDDITLVWTNDNYGYIRRFPSEAEQKRSGGHGLYYHSSYWASPSTSYLATSSTPLALMKSELRKAWDNGIRDMWVNNVGGLKPLEQETEFFLRSAWQAGKETTTVSTESYLTQWIDHTFSGHHGRRAATIYETYYQVNNQRKLEHLTSQAFPQVGYGDEAGRRLSILRSLYDATNEILTALPELEREAFFQLFAIKIHFAYLTNAQFVHADRSTLAYGQGKFTAADRHLEISRTFDDHKRTLIHFYNNVMAEGRWSGIFTPEQFPPPVMGMYPAAKPALRIGDARLGVVAWGEHQPSSSPSLTFWPDGIAVKWIEVFTSGAPGLTFTIEADPWIDVSRVSGTVDTEARISISIRDPAGNAGRTGTVRVISAAPAESITVTVRMNSVLRPAPGFVGSMEADSYISIDPSYPDDVTHSEVSWWESVAHVGRYQNDAMQARTSACPDHTPATTSPATLGYDFHLVTPGTHLLELHRLPTLNSTGRIRVAVQVDDLPLLVVESPTTDEHRGVWEHSILDNVERLRLRLPPLEVGSHTLTISVIDAYVTISKLVIYTAEPAVTNLGPEFSAHTNRPSRRIGDPDPARPDFASLDDVARDFYRSGAADLQLPRQVYAGSLEWTGETTFRPTKSVPQFALAVPEYGFQPDGTKDLITRLGSGSVLESHGVLTIEAEYALAESAHASTSPSSGTVRAEWSHTQSETNGRAGLAMHVAELGLHWDDPASAPGLHYSVTVTTPGAYHVWMLVKFDGTTDDACVLALNGAVQSPSEQFSGGDLCTYGTRQVWLWALISDLEIATGRHSLSVLARKSGLRVDRLYLTLGDELPPVDADWVASPRAGEPGDHRAGLGVVS